MQQLHHLPGFSVRENEPLSLHTRFALGGPARWFCFTANAQSFTAALGLLKGSQTPHVVVGGGSNLVVSDRGFEGVVLRYTGDSLQASGESISVDAGTPLQTVVDASVGAGLAGFESLTGIPGEVGGAIYGNAGAYGRSIQDLLTAVTFTDGTTHTRFSNEQCRFLYRESVFKQRKDWVILNAVFQLSRGEPAQLRAKSNEIRSIRDAKYPPDMRCAGSIFKNVFFAGLPEAAKAEVPPQLVREGKIPSAWFLEQAGVKGKRRGDIQVAEYHANLIYNDGHGSASDLLAVIEHCKESVQRRFGFLLQEEVQYVGFNNGRY